MSSHTGSFPEGLDCLNSIQLFETGTKQQQMSSSSSSNQLQISNPSSAASSVQNTDDEDGDLSERKQNSKERRREAHTQAEKKRRESIRKGYSDLETLIPNTSDGSGTSQKMSKAVVLQKSLDFVDFLQKNNKKQSEEIAKLRKDKQALTIMKESYEKIVQQHQSSAGSSMGKLSSALKFEIFTKIMEEMFVSFDNSVSTESFQELSTGVIRWIEEKCKADSFHSAISSALGS